MLLSDTDDIKYPTRDGRPMGETDVHRNLIMDLIHGLEVHYLQQQDVYVSGDLLMFYEKGNRRKHRSPDVLVALGVPKKQRDHYLLWLEGKAPDFIIEVTSKSTRNEDLTVKFELYERLGVSEYFIYDPLKEYLRPRLRGWRLEQGRYVPLVGHPLRSETLGLELHDIEDTLRIIDPVTALRLPTRLETHLGRVEVEEALTQAEEARTQAEEARTQAEAALAESEAARVRAERELAASLERLAEVQRQLKDKG